MRVCDKCGAAQVTATITLDAQVFDLCGQHMRELIGWIVAKDQEAEDPQGQPEAPPRRGPGRPRKA